MCGSALVRTIGRRAPLSHWGLFYLAIALQGLHAASGMLRGYERPLQLQGA